MGNVDEQDSAGDDEEEVILVEGESPFDDDTLHGSPAGAGSRMEWWDECKDMFNLAAPTAIGNLLEYLPVCTAMAVVGRLPGDEGKNGLDAMSLGRAYFNITANAPVFGMVGALRTLCPQAVGAGRPELLGLYLQQTMVVILVAAIPCLALQFGASRILVAVGESRELAALAQQYSLRLMPQYLWTGVMVSLQRVYQAHKMVWSNLAICIAGFVIAPPLQKLLVDSMGFLGAAWANAMFGYAYVAIQIAHLHINGMAADLFTPRLQEALDPKLMRDYLGLAAPAFLQVLLKWAAVETVVFLSGILHPPELALAASSIAANTISMMLMAWIGVMVATAVNVGRYVGSGNVKAAKRAATAGGVTATVLGVSAASGIYFGRKSIAALFTVDSDLRAMGATLLGVVSILVMLDSINNSVGGVLSGLGMQRAIALSQLPSYYCVGIPLGACLAFLAYGGREEGVVGLWIGMVAAMASTVAIQIAFLSCHTWGVSVQEAKQRLAVELPPTPHQRTARSNPEFGGDGDDSSMAPVNAALVMEETNLVDDRQPLVKHSALC